MNYNVYNIEYIYIMTNSLRFLLPKKLVLGTQINICTSNFNPGF